MTKTARTSGHLNERVAAFVTFNNTESYRRALDDYTSANNLLGRLVMPEVLKFKIPAKRLNVSERYWQ